jgi:hypothetical protein
MNRTQDAESGGRRVGHNVGRILSKIRENVVDRVAEIFWLAIKAAVVTAIILILLQIVPIRVHTEIDGTCGVSAGVEQIGTWGVDILGD